jgi:hypothetical protein
VTEPERSAIALPRFAEGVRRSVPEDEHAFDHFEEILDSWLARYRKARAAARYEERRFRESGLITARRQGAHLLAATAIRILDLGAGIILLVNARRAHPAYAAARSLVETGAAMSYIDQEVLPRLIKGRKDAVGETLRRMRLGLDPGTGWDHEGFPLMPIPVSSMIKALRRQVDGVLAGDEEESAGETMSRFYSLLSDHAHPNQSAQHLSSHFDEEGMMDWTFGHDWSPSSVHDVLGTTYLALHFAGDAFDRFLTALSKHPMVLDDKRRPQ